MANGDSKREPMLTREQIVERLVSFRSELKSRQDGMRKKAAKLEKLDLDKACELNERAVVLDWSREQVVRLLEDITIEKPPAQGVQAKGIESREGFGSHA